MISGEISYVGVNLYIGKVIRVYRVRRKLIFEGKGDVYI